MSKIALVTDSTSDLNEEIIKKFNIKVLPLRIIYKNHEYIDRVNITPDYVYDNLDKEIPHTSLPSINDIEKLFNDLEAQGYTHVIAVCISSGLSGTYNALKLVSQNYANMKITVFDSKALTLGAGAIIIKCGELIEQGKNYDEILEYLPKIRNSISIYYIVDTLTYLIKGGRIGKVSGTVGELLNIKPIISINKDGIYYTYTKVRGKKKALNKLTEIIESILKEYKSRVWVLHGGAEAQAKTLYEHFEKAKNITFLGFGNIGPVAGVHTGPGLIGITIMRELNL
ncbi:DegV family protein [Clostridium fermenticellae]|uniref:DegV family protein n=1 Tax=Clostridium fermenticellae TaxID=2068654 RepID=A0A386H3T5_9CLOT|nr:DegV family protein [Clostridium fermenticellae]AYD40326.1 DegV family protein [Clostridium fermenticellae]